MYVKSLRNIVPDGLDPFKAISRKQRSKWMGLEDTTFVGLPPSGCFLTVVFPGRIAMAVSSGTEMRYTSNF